MRRMGLSIGLMAGLLLGWPAVLAGGSKPTSLVASQNPRGLRVSNRSKQPLRLVLLARKPGGGYQEPVHWDFAPGEGEREGLMLSLPEGPLALQPGDILVAFSLDGSRRYWGPYVVGSTSKPTRPNENSDWQLIL
ncbi:MAG: hypothetical protein NZL92_08210 [Gloeomargarita sp. SKYG116]|nr:hypothetical protein [Gloeomargarita sp. SKYG116]MDW8401665.1 hypothetical protein [Gloeomargarita sp. SKYGB_i_bin116]